MKSALEYIGAVRLVRRGNHEQWSNPSRNFLLFILFLLHPSPEYKEDFEKYFRLQSAVVDSKLVSLVSLKLHATVHLSFSPFLRRLFNFCAPPFLTSGLLPRSASRVPPKKNPPLNINGRHSVQVRGIHANSPPGHPSTQMHQEWRRILGSIVLLWQTLLVSVPGTWCRVSFRMIFISYLPLWFFMTET